MSRLQSILTDVVLASETFVRQGEGVGEAGNEEEGAQVGRKRKEAVDELLSPHERSSQRSLLAQRCCGCPAAQERLEPSRHSRVLGGR